MEYSIEQIQGFARAYTEKLMANEYKVDILPNTAVLYHQNKELRDSEAIRTANSNSRLLREKFVE